MIDASWYMIWVFVVGLRSLEWIPGGLSVSEGLKIYNISRNPEGYLSSIGQFKTLSYYHNHQAKRQTPNGSALPCKLSMPRAPVSGTGPKNSLIVSHNRQSIS